MDRGEFPHQSSNTIQHPKNGGGFETHSTQEHEKQIRTVEIELVRTAVEDIRALRELAENRLLSADDVLEYPAGQRGALGLAMHEGHFDVVKVQLTVWAAYFATNMDELLKVFDVIDQHSALVDERVLVLAYDMAKEILGALNSSIQNRLTSASV